MRDKLLFHHLGVACADLTAEARSFALLGYQPEGAVFSDPVQRIRGCFMTGPGPRVELLAALGEGSPVTPWLSKGVKYYHQAFETSEFDTMLQALKAQRCKVVSAPVAAVAFDQRRITFLMLPNLTLIELIEAQAPGGAGSLQEDRL